MAKVRKWDVFVSHNHQQKPWVKLAVAQWRELGLRVFFDEDCIQPGENIVTVLEHALRRSKRIVLIISPSALKSGWVALETITTIYTDTDAKQRRLVPVVLEPTPRESLSLFIRPLKTIDLANPTTRQANYTQLLAFLSNQRVPATLVPPWEADEESRERVDSAPVSGRRASDQESIQAESVSTHRQFAYDVFLAYNPNDQTVVRKLAVRLCRDGIRVWFDEWEIKPGQIIKTRNEEGIRATRVLVLAVSEHSFRSEWALWEKWSIRFRNQTASGRLLVPLLLDRVTPTAYLAEFAHVDWRRRSSREYERLLEACRAVGLGAKPTIVEKIEADRAKHIRHPLFNFFSRLWRKLITQRKAPKLPNLQFDFGKEGNPQLDIPDYEIIHPPFGQGAYGKIWLARNAIGQWQALKVVYLSNFEDEDPYEREFNGIKRYKPLSDKHPGLLRVDFVSQKKPAGYFFYVMELGDPLELNWESNPSTYKPRDLVSERRKARGQKIPVRDCLRIGAELADALDFLHRQGLTHRDIKPQNIIFVNGRPKLADMGLIAEIRPAGQKRTYVGTPGYMPPPPELPGTPQADIYALGMLLYVLSTGRNPTFFPELSTTMADSTTVADFFRLNELILKACHPEPSNRFASAHEMHDMLVEIQSELE